MINTFLSGAIVMAAWVIALYFARFLKATGDRLFGFFAAAFVLLGVERIATEFMPGRLEANVYLVRLCAFLLILLGIWDKNRKKG